MIPLDTSALLWVLDDSPRLGPRRPDALHMRNVPEVVGHDPFDRMLVAQAEANVLNFLTLDRRLPGLDRTDIVDATE